jgi:hypothetical protein
MSAGCQHITQMPITNKKIVFDAPCTRCGEVLRWTADMTGVNGIIEYAAIPKGDEKA